jgi:hypothetical protein
MILDIDFSQEDSKVLQELRGLKDKNFNFNEYNGYALRNACKHQHIRAVQYLILLGVTKNVVDNEPLKWARKHNNEKLEALLA